MTPVLATLPLGPEILSESGRQAFREVLRDESPAVSQAEVLREFGL